MKPEVLKMVANYVRLDKAGGLSCRLPKPEVHCNLVLLVANLFGN